MTDADIVERIRKRFPCPQHAEDGLLSNEAADEIERLVQEVKEAEQDFHDDRASTNGVLKLRVDAERERCAKVADKYEFWKLHEHSTEEREATDIASSEIAAAIRAGHE